MQGLILEREEDKGVDSIPVDFFPELDLLRGRAAWSDVFRDSCWGGRRNSMNDHGIVP